MFREGGGGCLVVLIATGGAIGTFCYGCSNVRVVCWCHDNRIFSLSMGLWLVFLHTDNTDLANVSLIYEGNLTYRSFTGDHRQYRSLHLTAGQKYRLSE